MAPAFVMFGFGHLAALTACLVVPLSLSLAARRRPQWDRSIRLGLALLLAGAWVGWYALFALRGWLTFGNALPLNLCDWAAAARKG